jgi:methionyl aminopeptidase
MAIQLKSQNDIAAMRDSGRLVALAFEQLQAAIKPGIRLRDLDDMAAAFLASKGAETLYKGYRGRPADRPPFPGVICASVNNEICHGLPDDRALKDGDIVGIDIGLKYKGFCGDACVTYGVGKVSDKAQHLMDVTKECLRLGIEQAQPGQHLTNIGAAIQAYAEANGFSVVLEWGGHGLGRNLHEDPSVPHVGPAGQGVIMKPGMVFTIEPMINAGRPQWKVLRDGWTVVTTDGKLSAQFEHAIAITEQGPVVLSVV